MSIDYTAYNYSSSGIAVPFISGNKYYSGQLVVYYGNLYIVLVEKPHGYPGWSGEFSLVSEQGPMGPAGPAGSVGPKGITGPVGPKAEVVKPDSLTTVYDFTAVFSADQPINLGFNTDVNGTCINHTDLSSQINITQNGLYIFYYESLIHGGFGQNYPLNETMSLCRDGVIIPDSSRTVTLTSVADIIEISGHTILLIEGITTKTVITLSSGSDNIASDHTEVDVERLL